MPLFVPATVCHREISGLPLSRRLRAALRTLRVNQLGDLHGLTERHLRSISNRPTALMGELRELIALASERNWGCASMSGVANLTSGNSNEEQNELISIPEQAHGHRIAAFRLSARLAHSLEANGFARLGELHGLPYAQFLRTKRGFGRKTLNELREFAHLVERGVQPAQAASIEAPPSLLREQDCLYIPDEARELSPFELPISPRLAGVLHSMGIECLGDLHGQPRAALQRLRNCGKKTIKELFRLAERVVAGEFRIERKAFSPSDCLRLVRLLEEMLDELPSRDLEIILHRLGGKGTRRWSLKEVAAKFRLSGERVRQVERMSIEFLRKARGPGFGAILQSVALICSGMRCALTPTLMEEWLGSGAAACRWPLSFYVHLLGELNSGIVHPAIEFE